MHVSRYIHLNPYSGGIVKTIEELEKYPWSSFKDYIQDANNKLITKKDLLAYFNFDKDRYKRFVLSNAEHQKTLENVKYFKHVLTSLTMGSQSGFPLRAKWNGKMVFGLFFNLLP